MVEYTVLKSKINGAGKIYGPDRNYTVIFSVKTGYFQSLRTVYFSQKDRTFSVSGPYIFSHGRIFYLWLSKSRHQNPTLTFKKPYFQHLNHRMFSYRFYPWVYTVKLCMKQIETVWTDLLYELQKVSLEKVSVIQFDRIELINIYFSKWHDLLKVK